MNPFVFSGLDVFDGREDSDATSISTSTSSTSSFNASTTRPIFRVDGERGEGLFVSIVRDNVFRVTFLPNRKKRRVAPSFVVIGEGDSTSCHWDRDTLFHGKPPDNLDTDVDVEKSRYNLRMGFGDVEVCGKFRRGEPVGLKWKYRGKEIVSDLPSTSYTSSHPNSSSASSSTTSTLPNNRGGTGRHVRHYQSFNKENEFCYGMGEAAGRVCRNGSRIRLSAIDAMGYSCDALKPVSDPLYKHFPLLYIQVRDNKEHGENEEPQHKGMDEQQETLGWVGILYDTGAQGVMDIGCEVSAFRGSYRYIELEDGDLEYYMVFGRDFKEVVGKMTLLIGRPIMTPRWCLGYIGSTMAYTEADDAQEQLKKFVALCNKHHIPCDGFHLSSGYSCVDNPDGSFGSRCVFTWNNRRVPSPHDMFSTFNKASISVIPNIKPWLLQEDHPMFRDAVSDGVCLSEENVDGSDGNGSQQKPHLGLFWSGGGGTFKKGAYVDFSGKEGFSWWVRHCREQLLQKGAMALWNDNNEYEVSDGELRCKNELTMSVMRPVQGLLMAKASETALLLERPNTRPVVVTRSGCPGMQRHCVQTWSGDNRTSWETLQWNTSMSLSLSVCGWPGCGYDVGGFAGEMPEEELLIRWVQSAVFMPRFSIHSWNSDGTCTEPWSYPTATAVIRGCIWERYRYIPHMYNLYFQSHTSGLPVVRPLVFEFPNDPFVATVNSKEEQASEHDPYLSHATSCDYMLGESVLVCPIYTKSCNERKVYLPGNVLWFSTMDQKWFRGGSVTTARCSTSSNSPIYFVRNNSVIATALSIPTHNTLDLNTCGRQFVIYSNSMEGDVANFFHSHVEDDGVSLRTVQYVFNFHVKATSSKVSCTVEVKKRNFQFETYTPHETNPSTTSEFVLPFNQCTIVLPSGDSRELSVSVAIVEDEGEPDDVEENPSKTPHLAQTCENGQEGVVVNLEFR
eukprot:m.101770 g.101770  ORF g.101770 m.101770 type:complete len:957 (+) comp12586_c0_seq1:85-2955(+)